jgi:hypothetical protein
MATVGTVAATLEKREKNKADNVRYWGLLTIGVDDETPVGEYLETVLADTEAWVDGLSPHRFKGAGTLNKVKTVLHTAACLPEVVEAWGKVKGDALYTRLKECLSPEAMAELQKDRCGVKDGDDRGARIERLEADLDETRSALDEALRARDADRGALDEARCALEEMQCALGKARCALLHTAKVALGRNPAYKLKEAASEGMQVAEECAPAWRRGPSPIG